MSVQFRKRDRKMERRDAENLALSLIAFTICLALSSAYTGVIPVDPENPGKCIYRGDILKAGITNVSAPCQQLTCNEDGSILIEGCGKLRLKDCNRGERINVNKPYPECCVLKYKCKKADGLPYYVERDVSGDEAAKNPKSENST